MYLSYGICMAPFGEVGQGAEKAQGEFRCGGFGEVGGESYVCLGVFNGFGYQH